ncbi:Alpha/beta hydrolase fold-1 [Xylariaceae sp. FL1019]|nr:Alpha/beta hydrolase fold-1 [Xylariaceae sp. FL1019]
MTADPTMKLKLKPVIMLVHGAWHTPEYWFLVKDRLEEAGYDVLAPRLPSVCGPETVNFSWRSDVATVLDHATPLFAAGRNVVIVGHSYGGSVVTNAVPGNTVRERAAKGLKGGFSAVVYICAFPVVQRDTPCVTGEHHGYYSCAEPQKGNSFSMRIHPGQEPFYNDLPEDEAKKWEGKLQWQSQRSFEEPYAWCAQDLSALDVPLAYLYCEKDLAVPPPVQDFFIRHLPKMTVERCPAGHSPMISQPEQTTGFILKAVEAVVVL